MTAILIAGVVLLIGRVIYLVRGSGTQGTAVAQASAVAPALLGDVRLALPAGAEISQVSLSGTRVAVSHSMAGGGAAITILDLATGQVVSRVTIERAR